MVEGLGRELVRRGEDFVRGTEAGLDRAAKAARRGLVAADNAAHVIGINRIPVLRQYIWGQVHTGFWNSYEVRKSAVGSISIFFLVSFPNPSTKSVATPHLKAILNVMI